MNVGIQYVSYISQGDIYDCYSHLLRIPINQYSFLCDGKRGPMKSRKQHPFSTWRERCDGGGWDVFFYTWKADQHHSVLSAGVDDEDRYMIIIPDN